jgi:hypothetical protein
MVMAGPMFLIPTSQVLIFPSQLASAPAFLSGQQEGRPERPTESEMIQKGIIAAGGRNIQPGQPCNGGPIFQATGENPFDNKKEFTRPYSFFLSGSKGKDCCAPTI